MRALSRAFWILAFIVTSFCWMVVFQHGLSWQGFVTGAREEWQTLLSTVTGRKS